MRARKRALDEFKRALEVHKQWLHTARITKDPRHYELAVSLRKIAEEWKIRALAEEQLTPHVKKMLMNGD